MTDDAFLRGLAEEPDDPPIRVYGWAEGDETRFVPLDAEEGRARALTEWALGFVVGYAPDAGEFSAIAREADALRAVLDAALPVRMPPRQAWGQEGDGLLASLWPARQGDVFELAVKVHRGTSWQKVPAVLWPYARNAHRRGGMFLDEQDREEVVHDFGGERPPWLEDAPPPLRGPRPERPARSRGQEEIPF